MNVASRLGTIAAVLLLAQPAHAQDSPSGEAFAGIPNLSIEYYEVEGHSAEAIRRSLDAQRRPDANDGTLVDASARWHIDWTWTGRADGVGGCVTNLASVRYFASVRLPRLAHPERVPEAVLARWTAYIDALERHEAGHLRYALEQIGTVQAALKAVSCAKADAAATNALDPVKQHDQDYDRDTRHGATQGAVFP